MTIYAANTSRPHVKRAKDEAEQPLPPAEAEQKVDKGKNIDTKVQSKERDDRKNKKALPNALKQIPDGSTV